MAKKRANGEGNIRKRKDGRWEGRIVVGHKENGASIFRYIYADTQKELSAKLRQFIDAYQGVDLNEQSSMTLAAWLDKWLDEYMAGTVRPTTLTAYRSYADHYIKPTLGAKRISLITPEDVQRLYNHLKEHGRIRTHPQYGHTLSDSTLNHIHTLLHHAMDDAARARLIARNPTEQVAKPKQGGGSQQVLNEEQLDAFMRVIAGDELWHDFFYTELTTGLRQGELCGLRWEDLDEADNTLMIRRTVHRKNGGKLTVGETKTGRGTRKIVLPSTTAELLQKRRVQVKSEWIFPDPLNPDEPTNPNAAYHRMKVLLKKAGLPSIRFHSLRHTFSTHALASGVDAKTLAGILGHTKASFTLDTYTHVTSDMQQRAAGIVGDFMSELFGEELKPWQKCKSGEPGASI